MADEEQKTRVVGRRQKNDYTAEVVDRYAASLDRPHHHILKCALTGKSYAAMAQEIGVPIGTVRSRLSRARAALAALIAKDEAEAKSAA